MLYTETMFFRQSDLQERIDDMRTTTEEITKKINEFNSLHAANSRFLACSKLQGALNILEGTVSRITSSKNLSRNKRDSDYQSAMRSLRIATLNLEDAGETASYCQDLAPMS